MQGVFLLAYGPYRSLATEWLKNEGYFVRTGNPQKYESLPFKPDLVLQESRLTSYDNSLTRTLVTDIFHEDSILLLVLFQRSGGDDMRGLSRALGRIPKRAASITKPISEAEFLDRISRMLK